MSPQKYTVLGAGGFIGSSLATALRATGADCHTPARGDADIFTQKLGYVFYCIGLTADYRQRPFDTVEAHVSLLSRILAQASFDKLIYLSSTRLYDGMSGEKCAEDAYLILNPANPRHLYDLSKALGENLCLTASNGRACVARLSGVYDSSPGAPGFLSGLLQRLSREREFVIDSESGVVRDYVSLRDTVQGLIKTSAGAESEIINIASGENVSNQDIADMLNAEGCKVTLQRPSARENRPLCDITKLRQLGIEPVPVRDYLRNYIKDRGSHGAH